MSKKKETHICVTTSKKELILIAKALTHYYNTANISKGDYRLANRLCKDIGLIVEEHERESEEQDDAD